MTSILISTVPPCECILSVLLMVALSCHSLTGITSENDSHEKKDILVLVEKGRWVFNLQMKVEQCCQILSE